MLITGNLKETKVWRNIRSCINHNPEIAIDVLLLDFPWDFFSINVYVCFSVNVYVFRYIFYIMNSIDKHRLILFSLKYIYIYTHTHIYIYIYIYIYIEYSLTDLTPQNNINIITHHVWLIMYLIYMKYSTPFWKDFSWDLYLIFVQEWLKMNAYLY